MRKSALCRARALQILELKCQCVLERDDRRKLCLMGCTYWCKIMSRAAFDMICMFCNKLQGKFLTSSKSNKLLTNYRQGMKQDYVNAQEDVPQRFSLLPWPPAAMACRPPVCHWSSQAGTGGNTPKPAQKWWSWQCRHPREKEQEYQMLSTGDNFIGFNSGPKQHKEGTSHSSQWCLQPSGLQSPWRRNYKPFTMWLTPVSWLFWGRSNHCFMEIIPDYLKRCASHRLLAWLTAS